mmetsp:Transcript_11863/g.43376  ORF Transcript_11863/g.43376 Transcript_11863/m.43376 type:complete len:285 (+) Transcript_11863:123-977(+)
MKILCDACENAKAVVFCFADEANLCASCDSRIHCANKLASSHKRVAIESVTENEQKCDVCQDAKAYFFCRICRCVLCPSCDQGAHKKGTLGGTHERHLLTGLCACKPADSPEPLPPPVARGPMPIENKSTQAPRDMRLAGDAQVPVLNGNDRGLGAPVHSWTNLEELLGLPPDDVMNGKKWNGEPGFDDLDFVDDDFDMLVPVWEDSGNSRHGKELGVNAVPTAAPVGPGQGSQPHANNQYKNNNNQSNASNGQEMNDVLVDSENFEDDFLVPDMGDKKRRRTS